MSNKQLSIILKLRDEASKKLKGVSGGLVRFGNAWKRYGIIATVAIAAISAALTKLAMDAQESENLFKESMANMAGIAREWSDELSKTLGLNSYEIRKVVSTFNVMLKSMKLSEDMAYEMSKALTQLSYDMASFYNLRPEEAFTKLQSGISGEIEPLKRLGILVNENTIKAWALTNGMIKQGEVMTEQQKIWARFRVMLEQTETSQGDMLRTANSLTNLLRRLKSSAEELGIVVGSVLLPPVSKVAFALALFANWLKKAAKEHPLFVKSILFTVIALTALAAVLGVVGLAIPAVSTGIGVMSGAFAGLWVALAPIAPILLAVAAGIVAIWIAFKKWNVIKALFWSFVAGVNEGLKSIITTLARWALRISQLPGPHKKAFTEIASNLIDFAKTLDESYVLAMKKAADALNENTNNTKKSAKEVISVFDQIKNKYAQFMEELSKPGKGLGNVKKQFNAMEAFAKQTARNMQNAFSNLFFKAFTGELRNVKEVFADFGRSMLQMISQILAKIVMIKLLTAFAGGAGGNIFGVPVGALFHEGGMVGRQRRRFIKAHQGLAPDEVPIVAQTGEGVLSRRGMGALGGSENLKALNRGEDVRGGGVTINVNQVIQAWDAQDVWRNRKMLSNAIADDIYNNGKIRSVIRSYT